MKRLGQVFVLALAIFGAMALMQAGLHAVKRHYVVTCVDNDDDEGVTVPTHTASAVRL